MSLFEGYNTRSRALKRIHDTKEFSCNTCSKRFKSCNNLW